MVSILKWSNYRGDLHVAPFTDEALYMEQFNKVGGVIEM